jgi:uncharacterized coiled-coil DUF342 family protein
MSETPRTDKEIVGELLVFASFARKLERELAAVTEQRDWYKAACDKYSEDEVINTLCSLKEQRDDAIVEATNAVNDIIGVRWKLKQAEETAERYRLDANRFEAEVMMLKEKLKEYDDTLTVCTDNFSCKTFVPQKWELPPYDEQGDGTPIE